MIRGPISVGVDFSFPFAQHVYGIPEHASSLSLPTTKIGLSGIPPHYNEPYRLYNLDVFEYELDEPMALYGNIPLLVAHGLVEGKGRTTGIFWFNPSETFIDIVDGGNADNSYKQSHWMSESGEIDFFLLPGPTPAAVYDQYTRLTGRQQLPPLFSLGYHQCRYVPFLEYFLFKYIHNLFLCPVNHCFFLFFSISLQIITMIFIFSSLHDERTRVCVYYPLLWSFVDLLKLNHINSFN